MIDKKELPQFSSKDELFNYYIENQDSMEFKAYIKLLTQVGKKDDKENKDEN
jgi:hypothetical protein